MKIVNKPIGISKYETAIIEGLPDNLKSTLPTIEEIEQELEDKDLKLTIEIRDYRLEDAKALMDIFYNPHF